MNILFLILILISQLTKTVISLKHDAVFENIERNLIEDLFDEYEDLVSNDVVEYKEVFPRLKHHNQRFSSENLKKTDNQIEHVLENNVKTTQSMLKQRVYCK